MAVVAEEERLADAEVHAEWSDPPPESLRARFTLGSKKPKREWKLFLGDAWRMTVDGASNFNYAGASIVIVSPSGTVHESVVSIDYSITNNEAEYEALIAGLRLALWLDADLAHVFCDSLLIVGHLNDDCQTNDEWMNPDVSQVLSLLDKFGRVEVKWIGQEHNAHADALAGLAFVYRTSSSHTIIFDEVDTPSFELSVSLVLGPS